MRPGSPRKSVTETVSRDCMKTRKASATIPGAMPGRLTRGKVRARDAPSVAEASSSAGFIRWASPSTVRNISGAKTAECPTGTAQTDGPSPSRLSAKSAASA